MCKNYVLCLNTEYECIKLLLRAFKGAINTIHIFPKSDYKDDAIISISNERFLSHNDDPHLTMPPLKIQWFLEKQLHHIFATMLLRLMS